VVVWMVAAAVAEVAVAVAEVAAVWKVVVAAVSMFVEVGREWACEWVGVVVARLRVCPGQMPFHVRIRAAGTSAARPCPMEEEDQARLMVSTARCEKPMAPMSEGRAEPAAGWRRKRPSEEGEVTRRAAEGGMGSIGRPWRTQPGGRNASKW
jgi:hypothetical protein